MANIKLAPNLPVSVAVKFADLVSGNYGPQVRLKGTVDGSDAVLYLDVKQDALSQLVRCGALAQEPDVENIPERGLSLLLRHKKLIVTKRQEAGEKYPHLVIEAEGAPAAQPQAQARPQAQSARQAPPASPPKSGDNRPACADTYLTCLRFVLDEVLPLVDEHMESETIGQITATIFIQEMKSNGGSR